MSHYKPYPAYKDSGVEWIGKIPEHWEVKRLRHVVAFKNSNVDKKAYDGQEAVSLCNYTDVYYNEFITPNLPFMQATASPTEIEQFSLKKGDVIITKDSEDPSDIGIPSLVKEEVPGIVCGYHLTIIRGADFDTARLLHRIIQSHPTRAHFFVEAPGITRYGLSQDAIGDLRFCLPPENERAAIADHLDCETVRIDTLIAKKIEFIELLTKKRQALITHAVTKGLDPNVKMKDSGVEWIGEVPEHWEVLRLKWVLARRKEKNSPIQTSDILSLTIAQGLVPLAEKEGAGGNLPKDDLTAYDIARPGDLVINSMNVIVGAVGLSRYVGAISPVYYAMFPIRVSTSIDYYHYLFRSSEFQGSLAVLGDGILVKKSESSGKLNTIRLKISFETLGDQLLPLPPPLEQSAIVIALNSETTRIDTLIDKTQLSIDLLKKRRSALITAAVTGKIDLREST